VAAGQRGLRQRIRPQLWRRRGLKIDGAAAADRRDLKRQAAMRGIEGLRGLRWNLGAPPAGAQHAGSLDGPGGMGGQLDWGWQGIIGRLRVCGRGRDRKSGWGVRRGVGSTTAALRRHRAGAPCEARLCRRRGPTRRASSADFRGAGPPGRGPAGGTHHADRRDAGRDGAPRQRRDLAARGWGGPAGGRHSRLRSLEFAAAGTNPPIFLWIDAATSKTGSSFLGSKVRRSRGRGGVAELFAAKRRRAGQH